MKVLVIPDVHLKPWMFDRANDIINNLRDLNLQCVCLGDLPDDFGEQQNRNLYESTFDSAIMFAVEHPETLWCYGNHDVSYPWVKLESGFSHECALLVCEKLRDLENVVGDNYKFVHKIDNVVFSHGGLHRGFVQVHMPRVNDIRNIDFAIDVVNHLSAKELWSDWSPLWFRPQYSKGSGSGIFSFYPRKLLQVVGHTPVRKVEKLNNIISCDSFSTYPDGTPFGEQMFTIVDTETWKFFTVA